jgi:hypothetical protein
MPPDTIPPIKAFRIVIFVLKKIMNIPTMMPKIINSSGIILELISFIVAAAKTEANKQKDKN